MTDFAVQLEVRVQGDWRPVRRYDCAHGGAHIDRHKLAGDKRTEPLDFRDYREALALADQDINQNWERYRERFLEGSFS